MPTSLRIAATCLCSLACCSEPPPAAEWVPAGYERVAWHDVTSSLAPRSAWGPSGLEPLADVVDEAGTTPYELILEFHSGSPTQTGADRATWTWPLHFGIGAPFDDQGTLHMFECAAGGAVYEVDDYLAFCRPNEAILFLAYLAAGRVPWAARPSPPEPIATWWATNIAYDVAVPGEFTVVSKFAFYGASGDQYEVPVTFEPRAYALEPPNDDRSIERWRVAKYDDR